MCALNKAEPILPPGFAKSKEHQAKIMPKYGALMRHPKFLKAIENRDTADEVKISKKGEFKSTIRKMDVEAHLRAWREITGREPKTPSKIND